MQWDPTLGILQTLQERLKACQALFRADEATDQACREALKRAIDEAPPGTFSAVVIDPELLRTNPTTLKTYRQGIVHSPDAKLLFSDIPVSLPLICALSPVVYARYTSFSENMSYPFPKLYENLNDEEHQAILRLICTFVETGDYDAARDPYRLYTYAYARNLQMQALVDLCFLHIKGSPQDVYYVWKMASALEDHLLKTVCLLQYQSTPTCLLREPTPSQNSLSLSLDDEDSSKRRATDRDELVRLHGYLSEKIILSCPKNTPEITLQVQDFSDELQENLKQLLKELRPGKLTVSFHQQVEALFPLLTSCEFLPPDLTFSWSQTQVASSFDPNSLLVRHNATLKLHDSTDSSNTFERELITFLQSSPPIKCLSITFCRIDESMLSEFVDALLKLNTLHTLQLSFTSAGSKGATYCAKLITHPSLKNLVLSGNYFGDEGTQVLAAALPTCSLEHLNLSHNLITEVGLHAIAKVVKRHPTLKTINLSFNPLMSAPLFHAALRSTQSLSEIPLNRTLSGNAAVKISQLIEHKHYPEFLL